MVRSDGMDRGVRPEDEGSVEGREEWEEEGESRKEGKR